MKNIFQIRDMFEMQGDKKLPVYEIVVDFHSDGNGRWFPKFGKKELDTVRGLDRPAYYTTPGPDRVWILTNNQYIFLSDFLTKLNGYPKYEKLMGIMVSRVRTILEKRTYNDDDRSGIETLPPIYKAFIREEKEKKRRNSLSTNFNVFGSGDVNTTGNLYGIAWESKIGVATPYPMIIKPEIYS